MRFFDVDIVSSIKHNKILEYIFRMAIIHPLCYINPVIASRVVYFISTGKKLDLDTPKSFNEKIQYLKLYTYYNNADITLAVDKYRIRDYLKKVCQSDCSRGGTFLLNELVGKGFYKSVEEIDFSELPEKFVLKCNHDSGSVVICKDKKAFDQNAAKKKLRKALKRNYWLDNVECQYRFVKKGIICEKYLENEEGTLVDYKFYCFNGKPKMIYCTNPHVEGEVLELSFFDSEFHKLDIHRTNTQEMKKLPKKPVQFEKMKEIAGYLSKPFPFVRVDLFLCREQIYLGEMTFVPTGGIQKFVEPDIDDMLGEWLEL